MKSWGKLLLIYVLLLVGIGWFFKMSFEHFKENALTLRTATQQAEYASVLQSNRVLADTFFNEVLNREEVLAIVQKIVHSDGDERRTQRGLLYRSLAATYQRSKKNVGSILHFQFPDNRSMLRFHLPQKADDDLTRKRPAIAITNRTLQTTHGYGTGLHIHAYRHTYPLVYRGEHIGSVEVSQPYFDIFHKMQQLDSNSHTFFIVFYNKKITLAKLAEEEKQNFIHEELHKNLIRRKNISLIFKNTEKFPAELLPLITELKNNGQTQANISRGINFSQYGKLGGNTYSIIFHAVKNTNNKNVGYFLGITPEPQIDKLANKFWIYFIVTTLILLLSLLYRNALQTSLRQKNAQLRQIIDLVPHCISVKDRTGKFEIVNKTMADFFGTTVEDLTGRRDYELAATEQEIEHIRALDLEVIKSGKTKFIAEKSMADSNNNLRYLQTTIVPFSLSSTEKTAVLSIAIDITERKHHLNLIKKKQIELEALNNTLEMRIAEATNDLFVSNQNLRNLSFRMEKIRENERKELARTVHDEIGQILVAIKFELARLNAEYYPSPETHKTIETMDKEIALVMEKVASIVSELRPSILDDLGLYDAINWKVEEFTKRTGITCKVNPCAAPPLLSEAQQITLFRIFQEALSNVMRHAEASQVTIAYSYEGDKFVLRVTDNGRGITNQQLMAKDSFGLMGMIERAEQIGAHTTIEALSGGGTNVSVNLPLS